MLRSAYTFSDPVTPIMWGIVSLHDHVMFFLVCILVVVLLTFYRILIWFDYRDMRTLWFDELDSIGQFKVTYSSEANNLFIKERVGYNENLPLDIFYAPNYITGLALIFCSSWVNFYRGGADKSTGISVFTWSLLRHGMALEIIWTLIPSYILLLIAIPSFALLFAIDEAYTKSMVIKIIGHQWYWSYESSQLVTYDASAVNDKLTMFYHYTMIDPGFTLGPKIYAFAEQVYNFDSYMIPESDLIKPDLRLLKVDNALIVPQGMPITLIITSEDVLHSWSVQRFGIKVDAVPGRLSQASLLVEIGGKYYGQCSELCGVNHGFMPIEVWVVDAAVYEKVERFLMGPRYRYIAWK